MKPAPFDYHAPESLDDVLALLGEHGDEAKVLAGGQSLIPMLNLRLARFGALIDLRRVAGLDTVERTNGSVTIGAMVRQCDIEDDATVAESVPLLAAATPLIGHFQIRSRGTMGGSVAHADPAAEYPAAALALDATIHAAGAGGTRTIPASEFFLGTWWTALDDGDVLTAVEFPIWDGDCGFAVEEVARRHGDFAIAGAVCGVQLSGGSVSRAAIALFGMDGVPVRAADAESALVGTAAGDVDATAVGHAAVAGLEPPADVHASPALRQRIGAAVVTRALTRTLQEAGS